MMTRDSEAAVDNLVNVAAVSNNPGNVALGEHGLAGHSLPLLFEKLYILLACAHPFTFRLFSWVFDLALTGALYLTICHY